MVVEPGQGLDLEALIPKVVRQFDEPFADYSALPTYLVSQMARREVTVALSGDGGDEVFAGYQTHYAYRVARLYRVLPRFLRDRLIGPLVQRLPTSTERISFDYMAKRFVSGAHLPFERVAGAHPLNQLLYVDAKTFLLDDCLVKVDRMSMANSLEVRVPLLDHELVEYMARVPPRWKSAGLQTKSLLRDVVRPLLPSTIVGGKKRGFTPPLPIWLKSELRDLVHDVLSPARLRAMGVFRPDVVARLLDDHMQGLRDNNRAIWTLFCLVLWYERFL
jgi:asparagine synthase (glutamine-hydrolysing)